MNDEIKKYKYQIKQQDLQLDYLNRLLQLKSEDPSIPKNAPVSSNAGNET